MSSPGYVSAPLDSSSGSKAATAASILTSQVTGADYAGSFWSSDLNLWVIFNSAAGSPQLLIWLTDAAGNTTDTFSTWQVEASAITHVGLTSASTITTYSLVNAAGGQASIFSGTQLTLARDAGNSVLYLPTVDNFLAVNHPHTGPVNLSGDFVQDHPITAVVDTLTDIDVVNVSSYTYVWQKAASASASDNNWTDIADANQADFTPTADLASTPSFLRVKVTYTDELGYQEKVFSSASSTTVIPNLAPTAMGSTVYTGQGEPYTFKAADFVFEDAGDTLSAITLLNLPTTGQLQLDGTDVVIPVNGLKLTLADLSTHVLQWLAPSSATDLVSMNLDYKVWDSHQTASDAYGTLTLSEEHRPTSENIALDGFPHVALDLTPDSFTFNDMDVNDSLQSITITQLPTNGRLMVQGAPVVLNQVITWQNMYNDYGLGGFSYTPNGSGTAFDHFKFKVSDGHLESAASYDLQFNVTNPDGSFDVSGQVKHWKGTSPVAITGVAVTVGTNSPATTDSAGQFSLPGADLTDTTVSATKSTAFTKASDAGITLTDVLATLKVYLGRDLPADYKSPFNLVAADFDANGVVNLSDVLGLLKYYLGRTPPPTADKAWAFVNADDVSSDGLQITGLHGNLTKTDVQLNAPALDTTNSVTLIGVVRGDVDGSWAALHPNGG